MSFFKKKSVRVTPCSQSLKKEAVFCGTLSPGEVVPHPWSKIGRKTRKMVRQGHQKGVLSICCCKIDPRRSRNIMEPVLRPKTPKQIIPAKHPNSDIIKTFLEIFGRGDSGRIPSRFCKDSKRIPKGFCEESGRLLDESGRCLMIMEGF